MENNKLSEWIIENGYMSTIFLDYIQETNSWVKGKNPYGGRYDEVFEVADHLLDSHPSIIAAAAYNMHGDQLKVYKTPKNDFKAELNGKVFDYYWGCTTRISDEDTLIENNVKEELMNGVRGVASPEYLVEFCNYYANYVDVLNRINKGELTEEEGQQELGSATFIDNLIYGLQKESIKEEEGPKMGGI